MIMILGLFFIVLVLFSIYSYSLIDPNITFFQHSSWVLFREQMIQVGYYHRDISWIIYLVLIVLLFLFHKWFISHYKEVNLRNLLVGISGILIFSYPFLSHDFFNYMFDARILTFYGKNPYFFKALDFPSDKWVRFMHWTHRTYPYGPVFLVLSLIPSLLGFGKFTLTFILFKAMFIGLYALSVMLLAKLNKKWAIMFATHPLIIVEGLISSHNDLIALAFGIIGLYFLFRNKYKWGRIFFLFSIGIKYVSLPIFFIRAPVKNTILTFFNNLKNKFFKRSSGDAMLHMLQNNQNVLLFFFQFLIIIYIAFLGEIQPWYFLSLLVFIPFIPKIINSLWIFFFGLLVSYYPYIRLGGWDSNDKVDLKHTILIVFFVLNLFYLGFLAFKKKSDFLKQIKIFEFCW